MGPLQGVLDARVCGRLGCEPCGETALSRHSAWTEVDIRERSAGSVPASARFCCVKGSLSPFTAAPAVSRL